jgi:hypothetical protein
MSCALSVAIGSTQPWPEAHAVLESVYKQAETAGAEVILAVRDESGRPPTDAYPNLNVIVGLGETVFELRLRAVEAASAEIVAITEDHCQVAQDWCERIIASHAEFPEADVIGGAVANGACDSIGWAGFLISNGPFLPPLETRERAIVSGHANVTFKRRALWGWGAGGMDDGRFRAQLRSEGGHLMTDGRFEVLHVQWFPPLQMCTYQFHGGRAIAGSQRANLSRAQWWRRLIKVLLLPVRAVGNAPRVTFRAAMCNSELRSPMLRCQPWLLLLYLFSYSGELVGHLFGPGRSLYHLR